jgi:hypothetical protein
MDVDDGPARAELQRIKVLREGLKIRADTLPADLALAGLVDDLVATVAAVVTLATASTSVLYPLARIAFEDAQRIVALATDDDYLRIGTRAWLYYQRKESAIIGKTDQQAAADRDRAIVGQMREMWTPYCPDADELLRSEGAWLDKHARKPPDNFLGRDLAEVVQERHARLHNAGRTLPADVVNLNRGIYSALSRESHARLRLEPAAFVFGRYGRVEILPRPVDEPGRRRTLTSCIAMSLAEAAGALSYRLSIRESGEVAERQVMASKIVEETLPPGFKPDLGLHLARQGGSATTFHFLEVPIYKLGLLPEGLACWSAGIILGGREFIATFDVPAMSVPELAVAIGVPSHTLRPSAELVKHVLDGPPRVNVECTLGEVQRNADQTFVPLVVKRVARAGALEK